MKKIGKMIGLMSLIIVLGGISGVVTDRFLMPWLSSKESLNKWSLFRKVNENVTVINKTEQIIVKEDFSVVKTAQNILPSVVKIVSYVENDDKKNEWSSKIKSSQDIQESVKTGLIVTNDGLIVSVKRKMTDVGDKTLKYKILLSDNREFDAELTFTDEYSNLEFYKAEQENLPTPTFGNSRELESGEKVIVIGNKGGEYQNSFSLGVINEIDGTYTLLNSQLASSEKIEGAILTDAKINEKNIGGPVLDFNGTVIGIANSILKDGKEEGFIMPINKLRDTIDTVVKGGRSERVSLGVYYLSIDKEIALLSGLPVSKGALIHSFYGQQGLAVKRGSPADLAGVKIGDIILAVNNVEISLEKPLSSLVAEKAQGETAILKVLRENNKEIELEVVLK